MASKHKPEKRGTLKAFLGDIADVISDAFVTCSKWPADIIGQQNHLRGVAPPHPGQL